MVEVTGSKAKIVLVLVFVIIIIAVVAYFALSGGLNFGEPANASPTAKIKIQTNVTNLNEEITFDGSDSTDDKGVTNYTWNFGDGTLGYGKTVTHRYVKAELPGQNVTVKLTVYDEKGATSENSTTIYINMPPIAKIKIITEPPNGIYRINNEIQFSGVESNDSDGSISKYSWDFGVENTTNDTIESPNPVGKYSYSVGGNYTVTLTVEDNYRGRNTTTTYIHISDLELKYDKPWIIVSGVSLVSMNVTIRNNGTELKEANSIMVEMQALEAGTNNPILCGNINCGYTNATHELQLGPKSNADPKNLTVVKNNNGNTDLLIRLYWMDSKTNTRILMDRVFLQSIETT